MICVPVVEQVAGPNSPCASCFAIASSAIRSLNFTSIYFRRGCRSAPALALRATRFGLRGRPPKVPFTADDFAFLALFILPSATAAGFLFPISASGRNASTIRRAFSSSDIFIVFDRCFGFAHTRRSSEDLHHSNSRIRTATLMCFRVFRMFLLRVATHHEMRATPVAVHRRREVHLSRFF